MIVSDNCLDTTGAASAGLPGLTIGEQIGGMWKSMAGTKGYNIRYKRDNVIRTMKQKNCRYKVCSQTYTAFIRCFL